MSDLKTGRCGILEQKQCHVRDGFYAVGEAGFDAVEQLWFDDVESIRRARESAEFREGFEPDSKLIAEDRYRFAMAAREHWIIGPEARPGVNLDFQGYTNGYTPLLDALWHGFQECSSILIEAGARLDLFGHDGKRPLDLALEVFGEEHPVVRSIRAGI